MAWKAESRGGTGESEDPAPPAPDLLLTVEEAVVFETASTEQRVEGVQALLTLHRAGVGPIDVGRALGRQRSRQLLLRQLLIPEDRPAVNTHTHTDTHFYLCEDFSVSDLNLQTCPHEDQSKSSL